MRAVDIASSVARGERSPVEIAEEALLLADRWQPRTNAFSQLRPERTLAEARALEASLRGNDAGPLAGVPVVVKDLFDVEGWETTGCCAAYRGRVAASDATLVRRLRDAGAVIAGKANQHELAAGATNMVSACGPTRNPWDPERITGGSSGGSGAVVAAGVVPIALGTDTGGSIRIPASLCGVTGLKPTTGALPMDGVMPLAPSLDAPGPLAASAEDAALALSVLRGAAVEPRPVEAVRVALVEGDLGTVAREDVLAAVRGAADTLGDLGARLGTVGVEGIDDALEVWERVAWPELALAHPACVDAPEVHERTREVLGYGARGMDGLEEARRRMREIARAFLDALRDHDLLLLPSTPFPAPLMREKAVTVGSVGLDMRTGAPSVLTRPISLAGLPAISIPVGTSQEGLPLGAQLAARPGEEDLLVSVASAFQGTTQHHLAVPGS